MRHEGLWISFGVRKCILEIRLGSYIQDNLSLHFFPDIGMKICLCFNKKKYFNSLNPQLSKLHNFDFIVSDKPEKVNLFSTVNGRCSIVKDISRSVLTFGQRINIFL